MELLLEFLSKEWMLVGAVVVLLVLLIVHETRKSAPSLSPQQAITLINAEGGIFVDLRANTDYQQGHIVDAVNIPNNKLEARLVELEKYKNKPVVLVCKMGQHAGAASKQLKLHGYGQVYKMRGGMMEWDTLQLPLVS